MKICYIGSSGHAGIGFSGAQGRPDVRFVAAAPGSQGESVEGLLPSMRAFGGQPAIYDDYHEMLRKESPDVAIVNCHYGDHYRAALAVMDAGCHLFIEKPMAITLQQLQQLREAYERSGVQLATMLNYRYTGSFYRAWELIQQGAVGQVRLLNAQKSYKLGVRPPFTHKRESYGGTIPWVGIHAIDWITWMSGQRFQSVTALQSSQYNQGNGTLEMDAICQFQMTDEVVASLTVDYLNPKEAPRHGDDRIRVVGTRGVLEVKGPELTLINPDAQGIQQISCPEDGELFAGFLDQIEGKGQCRLSAEDSFYATQAAIRAQMAADSGERIVF